MKALRVDKPQKDIIRALQMMGATVTVIQSKEAGCPDLIVGFRGTNYLVECKTPKIGYLSPIQKEWHDEWRGLRPIVLTSADDAITFIKGVNR